MDDILDIDELTKDDSFFLMEDKDHDDIINIFKQWENNNNNNFTHKNEKQLHTQSAQSMQQQQQKHEHNEEAYKLNSRTFTRPRKKSAVQNLESQFIANETLDAKQYQMPTSPYSPHETFNYTPMRNVLIGGKVRTPLSARSMLQDTSPPSSMDVSLDNFQIDSSLITSADFANISFLSSTNSLETSPNRDKLFCVDNPAYTFSDMIDDRKALESLTLSGYDGTLIKDSQIAQIDDISLALFRAGSGSSTMENSTDSAEGNNGDGTLIYRNRENISNASSNLGRLNGSGDYNSHTIKPNNISHDLNTTFTSASGSDNSALQNTMVLSNIEQISDVQLSLVKSGQSFIIEKKSNDEFEQLDKKCITDEMLLNKTYDACNVTTEIMNKDTSMSPNKKNFGKPSNSNLNETKNIETEVNKTYYCLEQEQTPEDLVADTKRSKAFESTPLCTRTRYPHNTFSPAVAMIIEDANLSPIVPANNTHPTKQELNPLSEKLNTSYDENTQVIDHDNFVSHRADTYLRSPVSHFDDEMKVFENFENSEGGHKRRKCRSFVQRQQEIELQHRNTIEMQNVMDLAEAEAELLASGDGDDDERQFELMLDELSRVRLNDEQLKMKKSLETIKKRFNCTLSNVSDSDRDRNRDNNASSSGTEAQSKTFTSETREEALRHLRNEMTRHRNNETFTGSSQGSNEINTSFTISSPMAASQSSSTNSSERLLSRRSRLYDDLNLTALNTSQQQQNYDQDQNEIDNNFGLKTKNLNNSSALNTIAPVVQAETTTTKENNEHKLAEKGMPDEKTEISGLEITKYKLSEKRERDRDRFKTIKILKSTNDDDSANRFELNVPCIDDDDNENGGGDVAVAVANAMLNVNNENKNDFIVATNENHFNDNGAIAKSNLPSQRFSRRDLSNNTAVEGTIETPSLNINSKSSRNFLTYKKPRDKQNASCSASQARNPSTEMRSLSRPRYISGLQKCSVVSKAVSAGDLGKSDQHATAAPLTLTGEGKASQLARTQNAIGAGNMKNTITTPNDGGAKSPMGLKAKSLHNLATNASGITAPSRIASYGLRKINSGGIDIEKQQQQQQHQQQQTKLSSNMNRLKKSQPTQSAVNMQKPKTHVVFKKPQTVVTTAQRVGAPGMARPSSGYFSSNVNSKRDVVHQMNGNPSSSLNSNTLKSSRSTTALNNMGNGDGNTEIAIDESHAQSTKLTMGTTGIPEPSGLRPPAKRSALPRPSSMVRR